MDVDYTQDLYYDRDNSNSEPFIYLREFDEALEELNCDFVYPLISEIIDAGNLGSLLLVLNDNEVLNIKFTVTLNSYGEIPIKIKKSTKFTKVSVHSIISNKLYTYIHDNHGDLYKFKSSQTLEKIKHDNVLHLSCISSCFIMISKVDSKVVLYLYDESFDKEYSGYQRCVDLILPEDSIQSLENETSFDKIKENFTFAVDMLINITENDLDVEFFNCFLGKNLANENIKDILLVSMNDRLFIVNYQGTFTDEYSEMGESIRDSMSLNTLLISRGNIKAIKYLDSSLIILDDFWILTIFYQCIKTNVIKRKEIPLGDGITCFKFTNNSLVYSNRHKIIFMKFKIAPSDPEIYEINLKLITTFSVAQNGNFIVAIDRNKFFYYIPVPKYASYSDDNMETDEIYTKITKEDIQKFPDVVKYLENVEEDLKELSKKVQHESDMLLLLTHLKNHKNVTAGHCKIKFVPFLTAPQEDDIICDPINLQSGHSYMRIVIQLERIFSEFNFTIAFYRHTRNKGVIVRHIEVPPRKDKTKFAIYVPDDADDCPENKLEVFAHFSINTFGECHVLQFPFVIDKIKTSSEYRKRENVEIEKCIQGLNKMLQNEM